MSAETFRTSFVSRFDRKVEGMNLPLLSSGRINTLILHTLMETANIEDFHIHDISLKHEPFGPYNLTINGDIKIILHIRKTKAAVSI